MRHLRCEGRPTGSDEAASGAGSEPAMRAHPDRAKHEPDPDRERPERREAGPQATRRRPRTKPRGAMTTDSVRKEASDKSLHPLRIRVRKYPRIAAGTKKGRLNLLDSPSDSPDPYPDESFAACGARSRKRTRGFRRVFTHPGIVLSGKGLGQRHEKKRGCLTSFFNAQRIAYSEKFPIAVRKKGGGLTRVRQLLLRPYLFS